MADQTPEQKLTRAIEVGNVEWSERGHAYFARAGIINGADADYSIVEAKITHCWGPWKNEATGHSNQGGFEVEWSTVSAGFGSLTVYLDAGGILRADTQAMSKEFCKSVFAKLIDDWPNEGD